MYPYLSFPRKRESSFFALDHCFRRGDIVGFCFPQQELISEWLISEWTTHHSLFFWG